MFSQKWSIANAGLYYHSEFTNNCTFYQSDTKGVNHTSEEHTMQTLIIKLMEGEFNTDSAFDCISYFSIIIGLCFILRQKRKLLERENIYIIIFMISTIYRSWNISDEGAFLCFKPATIFNSCFSGRCIATIGEFSILNWILLKMELNKIPTIYYTEITLITIAETLSWCGCILKNSRFFCAEYVIWNILLMIIICTNINSGKYFARFTFLLVIIFNCQVEIPHFYHYKLERETSLFLSTFDKSNPVWNDRILFFFGYYNMIPFYLLSTAYSFQANKKY